MDLRRRTVVISMLAAFGVGAGCRRDTTRSALFDLSQKPLGIQLYMLGEEGATDPGAMFRMLAEMGYRRFESDLAALTNAGFRAAAARHGLSATSVHTDLSGSDSEFARIVAAVESTGVRYAGVPIFPFPAEMLAGIDVPVDEAVLRISERMTIDDWRRVADLMNLRGAALKQAGVTLFYHNHNNEFRPLGDTTPFQLLMENTDPALVAFELDVGWVAAAGLDPVEVMQRYPGRFRLMHVKDVAAGTIPNYAFEQVPAEVGSGMLNWPQIIQTARAAGITEYFVEQEPPFPTTRVEAARNSAAFLLGTRR